VTVALSGDGATKRSAVTGGVTRRSRWRPRRGGWCPATRSPRRGVAVAPDGLARRRCRVRSGSERARESWP
jgi:hypothetical protein